jgi:membrane dipeptidase
MQDVSQIGVITERLHRAGYTTAQIADIWGGNALRVLRQAQGVAEAEAGTP